MESKVKMTEKAMTIVRGTYAKGNLPNIPKDHPKDLQTLFNAMKDGNVIKSVTCFRGKINQNVPQEDFTIKDFLAHTYVIGDSANGHQLCDLVKTDQIDAKNGGVFFMHWVKDYELYPYVFET